MKSKILLSALLASTLLTAVGCGKNSDGTSSTTSDTSADPNVVEKVKGNGESWVEEIQNLIDRVYKNAKIDPIEIPFVNTTYYSATYFEASEESGDTYYVQVTCENDDSMEMAAITNYMNTFTSYYEENGFGINDDDYAMYRSYTAYKDLGKARYLYVSYGLSTLEDENGEIDYDNPQLGYGFILSYRRIISNDGWMGDYLTEWPTASMELSLGNAMPEPDFGDKKIQYFGGFNLIPVTFTDGSEGLLEVFIMWCLGSDQSDIDNYLKVLEDANWEIGYFQNDDGTDSDEKYAFNALSQIVVESFVMGDDSMGSGACFWFYLNDPDSVFTHKAAWPEEVNSVVPEYVETGAELSYYHRTVATQYGELHIIVIGGVSDDAETNYDTLLTSLEFTVTDEVDDYNETYKYATSKDQTYEIMFYIDSGYPGIAGNVLVIQAIYIK